MGNESFTNLPIPAVIFAIAIGLVVWSFLIVDVRHSRWLIGLMLFVSAINVAITWQGTIFGSWLLPLQQNRSTLFLATGVLLGLGLLLQLQVLSIRDIAGQGWMLLVIGLFQGVMRGVHDGFVQGMMSIGFAVATILPLITIIPALHREEVDWFKFLRIFMWVNLAWIACVAVQFVVNPSKLTLGSEDRFIGITSNPQHAAMTLSVFSTVALWLFMNDKSSRARWPFLLLFGIDIVMLMGTGSRTGILLLFIGLVAILYRRMGRTVLLLPIVAGVLYLAFFLAGQLDLDLGFQRVVSFEDTRTGRWIQLWNEGMEAPLIGLGRYDIAGTENSYLMAVAAFGLPMLALILLLMAVSLWHCFKLWRSRPYAGSLACYIDLTLGFNVMYFIGAMLEGHILARIAPMLIFFLCFSGASAKLLQQIEEWKSTQPDEFEEFTGGDHSVLSLSE
ncbi:MAG: O-antigen ligase family protein [Planctomycetota bacterium]|nr:O-antigen ligase family protein [Planctomycetota bacterium]